MRAALQRIPAPERAAASAQARALVGSAGPVASGAVSPVLCAVAGGTGCLAAVDRGVGRGQASCPAPLCGGDPKLRGLPRFSILRLICELGHFGIREPRSHCARFPSDQLDLILVPGVAFDLHGRRLGRGKGYYDQLLGALRGTTCGVAFDQQIVDEIPVEPHDVRLDCILTPTRWVELKA